MYLAAMLDEPAILPSDLAAFPRPHLAVDLVLLTVCEGALKVLMMERDEEPLAGKLVLPGGFVHEREPSLRRSSARPKKPPSIHPRSDRGD
jgi:hypothetical protein